MSDDVASTLADIRERSNTRFTFDDWHQLAADVRLLLAAVEAALKVADESAQITTAPPSGKEDEGAVRGLHYCAAKVREAITTALTGQEASDAR